MASVQFTADETRTSTRQSRLTSLLLVLAALAVLGWAGWYLSHRGAPSAAAGDRRRPTATVAVAVAANADIPIRLDALGTVTPIATATVQPQVSGVLTNIYYREGQQVERGEPLALIDPRPFQLALDQSTAQLARDQAELDNARIVLERDQTLLKQDSIAQQDVDTQQATVKQLTGVIAADRAAMDTAHLNLSYSRVTAPISGRVGLRPVSEGNYVTAGNGTGTGVATITQTSPIDVEFTIPADNVPSIQQRVGAGAVLPVTVLDRTRTTDLGSGTFLTLDNQIDSQTGTVRAKARFDNSKGTLFPMQFVNVQLQLDTLKNAIVVPAAAVRHGPNGDYVYVLAQDNTAHVRLVKTGPADGDRTSITSGLQVGERVVTEGGDRLTDGSAVRLPQDNSRGNSQGNSQDKPRERPRGKQRAERQ